MTDAAYEVGERYERGLDAATRDRGAHYTPRDVARMLVRRSLDTWSGSGPPVVCDPSCGGGVFLVAAAEELASRGFDPGRIVDELIVGADLDPGAVAASVEALRRWSPASTCSPRVVVADALRDRLPWDGQVDVVVGNPPFQNQLGATTSRDASERAAATNRFGPAAAGYVDSAALFLLVGLDLVAPGGVVTLVQPRSFLVARDAAAVRDELLRRAAPVHLWLPGERVFAAKVDVCAVTVARAGEPAGAPGREVVSVSSGRDGSVGHGGVTTMELRGAPTWSPLWATANGVPLVPRATPAGDSPAPNSPAPDTPAIGAIATATAGFRDQYYGLLPYIVQGSTAREAQHGAFARVATTAMIDPAECRWADRPVTIARERRIAPLLDRDAVRAADPALGAWVDRLMVPKVLVATQTKVIEASADVAGDVVPLTPVIAVVPDAPADVAHLEAALLAPAASAWALRRFGGGGMSGRSLKLAARQVLEIPLPVDRCAWDEGVAMLATSDRPRSWLHIGRQLDRAWGVDDEHLLQWWLARVESSIH